MTIEDADGKKKTLKLSKKTTGLDQLKAGAAHRLAAPTQPTPFLADRGRSEEIDGDQLLGMILKECPPALRGRFVTSQHVDADAYLRYRHRELANLSHPLNHIRSFWSIKSVPRNYDLKY